jgi:hypothetical protein
VYSCYVLYSGVERHMMVLGLAEHLQFRRAYAIVLEQGGSTVRANYSTRGLMKLFSEKITSWPHLNVFLRGGLFAATQLC